jgi:hypothetical protein
MNETPTQPAPAIQSERALIGALLQEHDRIFPVVQEAGITAASFTDSRCIRAWDTMAALRAKKPGIVDLVTVSESYGGDSFEVMSLYLEPMMKDCVTTAHAPYYAQEVRKAERRRNLSTAARIAVDALARGDAEDVVAAQLRESVDTVEGDKLGPRIISARDYAATPLQEPPQVIHGVIRAGQVGLMAASSKAGKSWALLHLGMAVPTGRDWLGWQTTKGRTLYINAELPPYDLQRRLERLSDALELGGIPDGLDVWHLRGTSNTIRELVPYVLRRQREVGPYALILPDPLYSFGGGRDENSNSEQAKTMAELSELAERSGAAVWIAHHFSKGNKAMTDHLDRASGAGMYARAVDVFATLTRHKEDDCYSVETTCRSFQRPEPFVVRWEYPLWRIDADLDPNDLKQQPKPGRTPRFTPGSIAELLPNAGMKYSELQKLAESSLGVKESRFAQLLKLAKAGGMVRQDFGMYFRVGVGP